MSPVWSQPSSSIASRGLLRLVAVAGHDERPADQHLAVVRELDLGARRGRADGPDLDPLRAGCRCRSRRSRTCPTAPRAGCRSRGRTRSPRAAWAPRPRSPTRPGRARAGRGSSTARARPPWRAPSAGHVLRRATFRRPTSSAHWVACFFAASCSASMPASIAAFSFSQMRGTAKNQVGLHLGQVGHHLARVGAAGGGEAHEHRQVVRAGPLGDVRHRQPRDDAALVRELDHLVEAVDRRRPGSRA